ncbi:MAG: PAS domain S-box protein [Desulforhopalus sp.]
MDRGSLSALFVGEEEDDYRLIKSILSDLDFDNLDISWAQDFDAGIEYAHKNEPDLILSDYHLGQYSGLDFMAEIRKRDCVKPVLLLTDKYDHLAEFESIRVGAEDYLEKSKDRPEKLKSAILKAIERSNALAAIQRSESRMRGIFLWSSIGIALFDMERLIAQSNPAFSNIIGYDMEQLCAMDIVDDFVHPDDAEPLREKFTKVAQKKRPYARAQTPFQKKNGDWIWVELTISLFGETGTDPQFLIGVIEDVTEKKNAQFALESSEKMLGLLSRDLISAQEDERRSIVLELHDVIGGNLGAAKYLLEKLKLQVLPEDETCVKLTKQLDNLIVDTIDEVQRLSTSLRPPMLDDIGILASLKWLVRKHNEIFSDITTTLDINVDEAAFLDSIKIVIFRLVQEALNNAAKHSQGNRIDISLKKSDQKIILEITDNGIGFDTEILNQVNIGSGFGLHNMYKRAESSDGTMMIVTQPDEGTTIHVEWAGVMPAAAPSPS